MQTIMKRQTISLPDLTNPIPSHPLAVRAGPFLFMSGQMGVAERSGRPVQTYAELDGEPPYPALGLLAPNTWEEAFVAQTRTIYDRIGALLGAQGSTLSEIVFHSVYLRDMRNFPSLARTRSRLFAGGLAPPVTTSQVGGLPLADAAVYFDPIGFVATDGYRLEMLQSRHLAQAQLSNYQFGSRVGPLMFFAGVVAAVPDEGKIVHDLRDLPAGIHLTEQSASPAARAFLSPIRAQAAFVYDLFGRFLGEQGVGFDDLVKLNIYLRDMRDTAVVEQVAAELAPAANPAVALYGVESLATRYFLIEIEGIAADPTGAWPKETLAQLDDPNDPIVAQGRHAVATRVGPLVFTSTVTAYNARTGTVLDDPRDLPERGRRVVEAVLARQPHSARSASAARSTAQAWLVYDRLLRIAARFGVAPDGFLKTTVYLANMNDFAAVEGVAEAVFRHERPALALLQPSGLSMPGARVQIDAVMVA
jgi:enamine deaminase RidA (YjgF/YER057c/UK114 family)